MELLKGRSNTVYLEGQADWSVTGTYSLNGATPASPLTVSNSSGLFSGVIPYLGNEGELVVTWNITIPTVGATTQVDYHRVITPYLTNREIKADCEIDSDADAERIEAAVRNIINSHTGQSFGRYLATHTVRGTGESTLLLPARLIAVTTFNGLNNAATMFDVTGDGWYLSLKFHGIPPVRADYYGLHMHRNGVIHNPNGIKPNIFETNATYEIEGMWGYKAIPAPVYEAARLLANDLASGDTVYRDRYLDSMVAADWRIQFNSGAFQRTGNARADQLLAPFVLNRGWKVV